ncbi:hypothetical protein KKC45_03105 [Patescibacteria group bacterium]|nr:hypothetical protein [Patescibacteria group bacterium]
MNALLFAILLFVISLGMLLSILYLFIQKERQQRQIIFLAEKLSGAMRCSERALKEPPGAFPSIAENLKYHQEDLLETFPER